MYSQIIIIPAYEPDQRLIRYVDQLLYAGFEKLIIVDDGSSTECQEIFRQIQVKNMEGGKVTLLHHPKNRGKGAALKTGILHGQRIYGKGKAYITVDSDGQHLVKDVIAVAKEMQAAPDALVLGCRDFSGRDVPWRSRFGNRITSKFFYLMNGKKVPDTQTGLRGIPDNLVDLALSEEGTRYEYEMDFLSDAVDQARLVFVPIQTVYEDGNQCSHFHPIRDSIRIYGRFLRFLVASLSGSATDLLLFALILASIGSGNAEIIEATVLARICSGIVNFEMNRHISFRSRGEAKSEMLRYGVLFVTQMAASAAAVTLLSQAIPSIVAKILIDVTLFFLSYMIQKKWVFGKQSKEKPYIFHKSLHREELI